MKAQILFYAPKHQLQEFIDLGWVAHGSLEGTHHGIHAVIVEWPFHDREPVIPKRDNDAAHTRSRVRSGAGSEHDIIGYSRWSNSHGEAE